MIRFEKLKPIIDGYKTNFPIHWEDEKYKWKSSNIFRIIDENDQKYIMVCEL